MIKKKVNILIFWFVLIPYYFVSGQNEVEVIKNQVINYLVNEGQLSENVELKELHEQISIRDIINYEDINSDDNRVYRLQIIRSHSDQYLLIVIDRKVNIINAKNLDECLFSLFNYFETVNLNRDSSLFLINGVLSLHKDSIDLKKINLIKQ